MTVTITGWLWTVPPPKRCVPDAYPLTWSTNRRPPGPRRPKGRP